MIFNIFKISLCSFLIFLNCFIADVRGKSITEVEGISEADFDSSELNSTAIEEITDEGSVTDASAGPCEPNPCENGGSCLTRIDYVEGFVCYCPVGFAGKKCEIVEENNCDRGDCGNATCNCCPGWGLFKDSCKECKCGKQFNCTFSYFTKTCLCGTGYTEEYGTCKADCKENPCKNGGECLVIDYEVGCRCTESYAGEFCEKNKCDGMNCQNNGTCYVIGGTAMCLCPNGYTGDECEKHVCDEKICQNNGTCYELHGKAACQCLHGYTGDECEKLDLCPEVCGENPGVVCDGDKTKRDAIKCFCKDQDKIFDQESKECKVKKDMNTCFFNNWHVSWETAAKACAEENSTLLCYKTRKEMEDILESFRLTAIDHGKLAIWLGSRNCTRKEKEMEKCLSLNVDKSGNSVWHYFRSDCDKANPFVCCVDETNECDRVKCQNGGICNIIDGKAVCDCPIGYTGDLCEKHPCFNKPCLNGGQCIVSGPTFNCICREPYTGKFCESNPCAQYICKNGGTCKVIQGEAKCFCEERYIGKFCDVRLGDCATNVCENGGICRIMNGKPMCFCVKPYIGKFCQTRTDFQYTSTAFVVVYILLGLVLILLAVMISCCLCRGICFRKK